MACQHHVVHCELHAPFVLTPSTGLQSGSVRIDAGPDSARVVDLPAGRYLVGRAASCDLTIADPEIEAHHLLVELAPGGLIRVVQLAGRSTITIDGLPHRGESVRTGGVIQVGATRLTVRGCGRNVARLDSTPLRPDTPWATLAAVERSTYLARAASAHVVDLGVGTVRLPLGIDMGSLPLEQQPSADAAELHENLPVLANVGRGQVFVLALRGQPEQVGSFMRAIVEQLPATSGRELIVTDDADVAVAQCGRSAPTTVLLMLCADAAVPDGCDALVEFGSRWRAVYTADLGGVEPPIRFHAAGHPPHCELRRVVCGGRGSRSP